MNALYTAGQLAIFRNIQHFRDCFTKGGTGNAYLFCEAGNRLWDEKFSMMHAARHKDIRIAVDFSVQFAATGVSTGHWKEYTCRDGVWERPYRPNQAEDAEVKVAGAMEYAKQKIALHECTSYWGAWVWTCVQGSAHLAYKWRAGVLEVEHVVPVLHPPPPGSGADAEKLEHGVMFHMFTWKTDVKKWQIRKDGWKARVITMRHGHDGDVPTIVFDGHD